MATTDRERALLDLGFMHDATNENVRNCIAADREHIARMEKFLAEFAERRPTNKPLGKSQIGVLEAVNRSPYPGAWVWANHSTTVRILESLITRGLVTKTDSGYYINQAGTEALAEISSRTS